jgi:polysaccharide pyruvyl transferase WcaK-like protein
VAEDCYNALTATFPDRVEMLRPPLNAWELKHLAGMVDLVLTGRMHLAIAALGMGTPPLCVAYMNKFEGLFQLFDIDGLEVEPALVSECDEILAKMAEVVGGLEELEGKIKSKLPEIMDLSAKNFETLAN